MFCLDYTVSWVFPVIALCVEKAVAKVSSDMTLHVWIGSGNCKVSLLSVNCARFRHDRMCL